MFLNITDLTGAAIALGLGFSVSAHAASTSSTDELATRQAMAVNRLLHGTEPTFTPEFILADVASTQTVGKRRFDNFHGDISGRYLSAIAQLPRDEHPANFEQLIHDIVALQQADGRFGRASLEFTPDQVGGEHMALLWGNGRLLVGLLDVYTHYPSDEILVPVVKLGDFFLKTIDVCSTPEMAERLKGLKAHGYICFTQLTEGLAMLSERTGDRKYAEAAQKIYPMLPERGLQHSHGYLATLRGVMMVYNFLGNSADLAFVEKHYADLIASSDYTPFGSVNEYFGTVEQHKGNLRTEGCSDADFLSLSLQLWRATDKVDYLKRAEHCLVNAFSFNQFSTGDFGHHTLNGNSGYRLDDQDHRAWWCCTMHGMRYLAEAREYVASRSTSGTGLLTDSNFDRRILTTDGKYIPLESITTTTRGYLFNGPFLMVADGKAADAFLAEPSGGNVIDAKSARVAKADPELSHFRQESHLEFDYKHDGFPGIWSVRLRPMGDITFGERVPVRALLTFN